MNLADRSAGPIAGDAVRRHRRVSRAAKSPRTARPWSISGTQRSSAVGIMVVLIGLFVTLTAPLLGAQTTTAQFVYPRQGAQNVDTSSPFQWTTVPGALAYYLYVGTSQGAKDLVNTGEIPQTSYTVPPLPSGVTL